MANALNQNPQTIDTTFSTAQQCQDDRIWLVWKWAAATDGFTLKDGSGNTLMVFIATTGQTTGMWACPIPIRLNNTRAYSITISGTAVVYVFAE